MNRMNNVKSMYDMLLSTDGKHSFLINGKYAFDFINGITFTQFEKDQNSSSLSCYAEGIAYYDAHSTNAKLIVIDHIDLNFMSGSLLIEKNGNTISINVITIEEMK